MRLTIAAALIFGSALTVPASAASDPKVDFLGYCIEQGNSTTYCGCMTDALAGKLQPKDFLVYLDYLKLLAAGERDQETLITKLEANNKITDEDLARILKVATETSTAAEKSCAGL